VIGVDATDLNVWEGFPKAPLLVGDVMYWGDLVVRRGAGGPETYELHNLRTSRFCGGELEGVPPYVEGRSRGELYAKATGVIEAATSGRRLPEEPGYRRGHHMNQPARFRAIAIETEDGARVPVHL
jgi:hypothetical protein